MLIWRMPNLSGVFVRVVDVPVALRTLARELHSAWAPRLLEAAAARTHTLPFLARWVARSSVGARSPVAFLVATPRWSPDGCAACLWSFCGAQHLGKAATWCPQVVFLQTGTCWTRPLSSVWGD